MDPVFCGHLVIISPPFTVDFRLKIWIDTMLNYGLMNEFSEKGHIISVADILNGFMNSSSLSESGKNVIPLSNIFPNISFLI